MEITTIIIEDSSGKNQLNKINVDYFLITFHTKFDVSCLIKQRDPHKILFKFPKLKHTKTKSSEILKFLRSYFKVFQVSIQSEEKKKTILTLKEESLIALALQNAQYLMDLKGVLKQKFDSDLREISDAKSDINIKLKHFEIVKSCFECEVSEWEKDMNEFIIDEEDKKLEKVEVDVKRFGFTSEALLRNFLLAELKRFFKNFSHHVSFQISENNLTLYGRKNEVSRFAGHLTLVQAPKNSVDAKKTGK
jgi:hypothetical protein